MIRSSFVGDISLGEHYFSFGHGPRTLIERGNNIFDSVSHIFNDSDFVIGNLEGPISDIGYDCREPNKRVFRGSPKSARLLKLANINVLNIANNHSIQHGSECLLESIDALEQEGLTVIGKAASPIVYLQRDQQEIAFIGCSLVPDNTDLAQTLYFSPDIDLLLATVRQAKKNSDHVILYIHWGTEGAGNPSDDQRTLAQRFVNAGATIVVGHHTHSLQPVIATENSLTAFSLGNFVFDLPWGKRNRESVILNIHVEKSGIKRSDIHNLSINANGKPIPTGVSAELHEGETALSAVAQEDPIPESVRKLFFFISHLPSGDSMTKTRFLLWKVKKILR